MSEAGDDSGPLTPTSQRPAPPLDPWCDASKTLVERSATLREGRVARARVVLFQTLVSEMPMRRASMPPDTPALTDLFSAAFGDPTGREFWRLRLQSWVDPGQFAEMLATFLAVDGGNKAAHKLAISVMLTRDLTAAGKVPPIVERANSPIVGQVDPASGQLHAFVMHSPNRLEGDSFDPDKPLRWMAEREIFHDLLPASLLNFLQAGPLAPADMNAPVRKPALAHRPRGPKARVGPRVEVEMREAIAQGTNLGAMKQTEMAAHFKAAQSVCRVIRKKVLGEAGDN